jgi:DNA phosphorothioation-associated DGQHR protein 1
MSSITFPYKAKALKVDQPLGTYYAAVLPAELLLEVCYSDRLKAQKVIGGTYVLAGTQRNLDEKRLKAIASFVSRSDSAFPNTIILAANSRLDDGLIEESDSKRWSIEVNEACNDFTITIPTQEKLTAIIDGQHRLFSFAYAPERLSMPLVCSVFFDLPKPFQAQLFATINSTQKPVDKSQTYELFGYNISEESERFWSPDKLAVFLARRLNTEKGSPFAGRIAIAPEADAILQSLTEKVDWRVSMATVVQGIVRLISTNPKQDGDLLQGQEPIPRSTLKNAKRLDRSPMRPWYVDENDALIYAALTNFLAACNEVLWKNSGANSFIHKTVGVQALFDVLRVLTPKAIEKADISVEFFQDFMAPSVHIDFGTAFFRNASGSGRTAIRDAILKAMGINALGEII